MEKAFRIGRKLLVNIVLNDLGHLMQLRNTEILLIFFQIGKVEIYALRAF